MNAQETTAPAQPSVPTAAFTQEPIPRGQGSLATAAFQRHKQVQRVGKEHKRLETWHLLGALETTNRSLSPSLGLLPQGALGPWGKAGTPRVPACKTPTQNGAKQRKRRISMTPSVWRRHSRSFSQDAGEGQLLKTIFQVQLQKSEG